MNNHQPPWPHTINGETAQITGLNSTEYVATFNSLFQRIDTLMQTHFGQSTYDSCLDGGDSALNWTPLYERFHPELQSAISELEYKLSYYTSGNGFSMLINPEAKTAITRAGGFYSERENYVAVKTPGGWLVTYPEPHSGSNAY